MLDWISEPSPDDDNEIAHFLIERAFVVDAENMLQEYDDFVHEAFSMS